MKKMMKYVKVTKVMSLKNKPETCKQCGERLMEGLHDFCSDLCVHEYVVQQEIEAWHERMYEERKVNR